jgi:hypothetical protein
VLSPVILATQEEDRRSKPDGANSLWDPIWKKTLHEKGLVKWLKV